MSSDLNLNRKEVIKVNHKLHLKMSENRRIFAFVMFSRNFRKKNGISS